MKLQREKILAHLSIDEFIGRSHELETLLGHAKGENKATGLLVLSAPCAGVSELLRQTYDRLFYEQGEIIPFCFALRKSDKTAKHTATRFLQSFLQQTVAFRRQDSKILDASCDIYELAELALPSDGYWIDRLIETSQTESKLDNELAYIKNCLSAPLRAFANGARVFVMIDDLHEAEYFTGEIDFARELGEIFSRSDVPFVFGRRRRFLSGSSVTDDFETLQINPLSFADSGFLIENLSAKYGVRINEQTRDLLAVQFEGNPLFVKFLFQSASEKQLAFDSFHKVERIYADEIFGGKIAKFYDTIFEEIAPKTETQKNILSLLFDALSVEHEKTHIETWQSRTALDDAEFGRVTRLLNMHEIFRLTSNLVETMSENLILSDYIGSRFRLEIILQNRALTVGETLSEFLKRAPRLMADFYRRNSAIGLRELLGVFDCQEIPKSLIDYSLFKDELKGAPNAEILRSLKNETEKIVLPQIIYTAHTVSFYAQFAQVVEKERSAVALGFIESKYSDDDETVWIAAEIAAIGLRELLGVFDCQEIPKSLIDYSLFKDELKGAPNAEILKSLKNETEKIVLPQIIYTAHTVSFYAQFAQVVEKERSAVALGFIESKYSDDDETVWIAAEIDSKLEAKKELAEFWCDRLEMVALVCNFLNYKIWLVAPEGFSPDAIEVLRSRNAFGSSKKQVALLVDFLGVKDALSERVKANEYEMVVPMGEDTELIAAQTVEEIAKRHHFAPRAINQIKTALVEACINATEHSLSPDRKIYQKFTVEDDKIIITISNRGLRLADKKAQQVSPDEGRRGWGLKLMKTLMDEVKFEQTDDGTRISMTKYLKK